MSCLTRDKMLLFCRLYGQHFSANFPVFHRPSFQITQTPPLLLAAILIVGACYAREHISTDTIVLLAIFLLNLIENEEHELKMLPPPLSTIQASVITCSALIVARSETACRFLSTYVPRNYCMAQRAGLFDGVEIDVDYSTLTETTFDWQSWIHQETQRRLAAEILSREMAGCIFQGTSPEVSYLDSKIPLPSYERCWEAQTPAECLQVLQQSPNPIPLSEAIHRLRTNHLCRDTAAFESSGFGMFVLIKGVSSFLCCKSLD